MKIKLSELKKLVRESLAKLREDYEVASDDSVDLENPTVLWNNTFGMNDQETMTKVANRRINLNEPDDSDENEIDSALRTLLNPSRKTTEVKDSYGCESDYIIKRYAKKKSKLKDKPLSMKEAMPPKGDKYPDKDGWQGETYRDRDKLKPSKKKKEKPAKQLEGYPDKDGWQGETYRDNSKLKPGKKKKQKTAKQLESAPKGWEGTVKKMKNKKGVDNPFALAHYMKNKGFKSHKTKKGKNKQ